MTRVTRGAWALLVLAATLGAGSAGADSADDLVVLINHYRAAPTPCGGRSMAMAPPLSPSDRLAKVSPSGPGELGAALNAGGYPVAVATSIRLSGPSDAATALQFVAQRYCAELLDPRFSQISVTRSAGNGWRINLAKPLLPADLGDWQGAGKKILELANAARARPRQCGSQRFAAAAPLAWNDALGAAALAHSRDMAERDYFEHTDPEGRSVAVRAAAAGYRWRHVGENIAAGLGEPAEVMAGWLASPGHCANIMSPDFVEMGAAFAVRIGTTRGIWWTQTFGRK